MRILSIDPSIVNVGFAILEDGVVKASHTIHTDDKKPLAERLVEIISQFEQQFSNNFNLAIIEYPSNFVRVGGRGNLNFHALQLLHVAIGVIFFAVCRISKHVEFVKVSDWKGNQKKGVSKIIAEGIMGHSVNEHEADAIAMAMWYLKNEKLKKIAR